MREIRTRINEANDYRAILSAFLFLVHQRWNLKHVNEGNQNF
jgi:hypothetical protein